jgi:hypothetical protein
MAEFRLSGTPTATAPGSGARFRPARTTGPAGFAFDTDNRKNHHGSQAIACNAICRDDPAPRCRIRRKFDDGAHFCSLWLPARIRFSPATWRYSEQNMVNGLLISATGRDTGGAISTAI